MTRGIVVSRPTPWRTGRFVAYSGEFESGIDIMAGLTEKQEKFCKALIETGNQSEAYRRAYNTSRMKPESITSKAHELMKNGDVAVRLDELRKRAMKRHDCTVDSLVAELEEIKQVALSAETPQTSAAVSAVMGKAKLCGLDKQLVELSGTVGVRRTLDDFYGD